MGATGSFRPARALGGPSVGAGPGQGPGPGSVDLEPARLVALSRMICSMLGSTEAEQQLVGARAAAGGARGRGDGGTRARDDGGGLKVVRI